METLTVRKLLYDITMKEKVKCVENFTIPDVEETEITSGVYLSVNKSASVKHSDSNVDFLYPLQHV